MFNSFQISKHLLQFLNQNFLWDAISSLIIGMLLLQFYSLPVSGCECESQHSLTVGEPTSTDIPLFLLGMVNFYKILLLSMKYSNEKILLWYVCHEWWPMQNWTYGRCIICRHCLQVTCFCIVKNVLFHNQLHYSKF